MNIVKEFWSTVTSDGYIQLDDLCNLSEKAGYHLDDDSGLPFVLMNHLKLYSSVEFVEMDSESFSVEIIEKGIALEIEREEDKTMIRVVYIESWHLVPYAILWDDPEGEMQVLSALGVKLILDQSGVRLLHPVESRVFWEKVVHQ
jgi:hypothetical protein